MNKTDIINGGGVFKGKPWYKIDINKIRDKLTSNDLEKLKNKLEYNGFPSYFWIYTDNFDKWFNELNDMLAQQEEPKNEIDKIFNTLVRINHKYDIENMKKYFGDYDDLYDKAINLTNYHKDKTYYLPVGLNSMLKELIQEAIDRKQQYKDNLKEEGKAEAKEEHKKEIEQLQQQHIKEIQAERDDKVKKVAYEKNKHNPTTSSGPIDAIPPERTITTTTNSPSIKNFIKDAYINGDYKCGRDELRKRYTSGKYANILKDVNIDNVINDVMLYSELELSKQRNKLAQLAQIGAFSPEAITHMDPNTQQVINDAIVAKSRVDNANRRLKYKLPINKPKAKQAMLNGHINPMLFRGAYSTGNY